MASSATYAFDPSVGNLTLNAFGRIQIRRSEITQQHLADAATEANLLQVEFANRQPNLWTSELYEVSLVAGTATYALPARMISPMAVYLNIEDASGESYDRILGPISTLEYAALPDKEQQAQPTTYWYNRQATPEVTLWPVPDDAATYTLKLQILSQIQDAKLASGVTPQVPYRWIDAWVAALAARLAAIWRPEIEAKRQADAERAWQIAAKEDIEYVSTFITPGVSGYFR